MPYKDIEARRESKRRYRQSLKGLTTHIWSGIIARAENRDGKSPDYTNVKCNMTREEFVTWYTQELPKAKLKYPDQKLSIDRINDGNYEIDNLQIIPLSENVRKRQINKNIYAPEGMNWCYGCEKYLPIDQFYKNKGRFNGIAEGCKTCRRAYNKIHRKRK